MLMMNRRCYRFHLFTICYEFLHSFLHDLKYVLFYMSNKLFLEKTIFFWKRLIAPFNSAIAKNKIFSVAMLLHRTINDFHAGWVECGKNKNMEKIFFALPH